MTRRTSDDRACLKGERKRVSAVVHAGLPLLLERAFQAYRDRVDAGFPTDAKEFISAQSACRAALTHVVLLLKLLEQLAKSERSDFTEDCGDLDEIISEARAAIER